METAQVLTDGHRQTVSIPQAYRFDVDEVFVNKIGDALILTPVGATGAAGVVSGSPARTRPQKRLGLLEGKLHVPDDFDAPLPPEILAAFEGDAK